MESPQILDLFPPQATTEALELVRVELIDVSDWVPPSPEFVESVRRFGIIQPPRLCRQTGSTDRYQVVDGRRRVLAAKQIGLEQIAVVVSDMSYADAQRRVLTLEAQQKHNDNPVAEYEAIRTLIGEGYTKDDIQRTLGISGEKLSRLLSFSTIPEDVLQAVQDQKVSVSTAVSMSKLSRPFIEKAADKFRESGTLTGNDVVEIKQARRSDAMQSVIEEMEASQESEQLSLANRIIALKKPETETMPGYDEGWNDAVIAIWNILGE